MRAMILAAGRGNRMRPLTDHTPKPLLEVNGRPLIIHLLQSLSHAGFAEIIINLGHLSEKIERYLGNGAQFNVKLHYSYEDPVLETGGGIAKVLPWLQQDKHSPFLVVSGDIYTDYPFEKIKATAEQRMHTSTLAHLVLVDNPPHHLKGDYALCPDGRVNDMGGPLYNFAGIGVYRAELFKDCPKGSFRLPDLFKKAFATQGVTGEYYAGKWFNIGTPEQLKQVNEQYHSEEKL